MIEAVASDTTKARFGMLRLIIALLLLPIGVVLGLINIGVAGGLPGLLFSSGTIAAAFWLFSHVSVGVAIVALVPLVVVVIAWSSRLAGGGPVSQAANRMSQPDYDPINPTAFDLSIRSVLTRPLPPGMSVERRIKLMDGLLESYLRSNGRRLEQLSFAEIEGLWEGPLSCVERLEATGRKFGDLSPAELAELWSSRAPETSPAKRSRKTPSDERSPRKTTRKSPSHPMSTSRLGLVVYEFVYFMIRHQNAEIARDAATRFGLNGDLTFDQAVHLEIGFLLAARHAVASSRFSKHVDTVTNGFANRLADHVLRPAARTDEAKVAKIRDLLFACFEQYDGIMNNQDAVRGLYQFAGAWYRNMTGQDGGPDLQDGIAIVALFSTMRQAVLDFLQDGHRIAEFDEALREQYPDDQVAT